MTKDENKVNFDMSTLSLEELIKVYEEITDFLKFLEEKKVIVEEKAEEIDD